MGGVDLVSLVLFPYCSQMRSIVVQENYWIIPWQINFTIVLFCGRRSIQVKEMLIIWSIVDCLSRKLLRFTRSVVKAKALANQANLIGLTERLVSYHQQLKSQSSEKLCPLYKTYKVLKKIKPLKGHLNENTFSYLLFLIRITGYAMSKNLLFYRYLWVFFDKLFWFSLIFADDCVTWLRHLIVGNKQSQEGHVQHFLLFLSGRQKSA